MFERNPMKKKSVYTIGGAAALFLLILYMSGLMFSSEKIRPSLVDIEKPPADFSPSTATALTKSITETYEAIGTVRPRTETRIEAQVTGKVIRVRVKPGDAVSKGGTLIILDDREFISRLDGARQGLRSSQAAREEARRKKEALRRQKEAAKKK